MYLKCFKAFLVEFIFCETLEEIFSTAGRLHMLVREKNIAHQYNIVIIVLIIIVVTLFYHIYFPLM